MARHEDAGARLIPARAGKTSPTSTTPTTPSAHPRACGENALDVDGVASGRGSSPRVRGKPAPAPRRLHHRGLIPARAGKTRLGGAGGCCTPAHPRACGENLVSAACAVVSVGSSPRVRGKPVSEPAMTTGYRLIPARAGKTSACRARRPRGRAHPRACGENPVAALGGGGDPGSSPRVRGKQERKMGMLIIAGLIPARAGKTRSSTPAARPGPAHPRACGENSLRLRGSGEDPGSSPRVRGKRHRGRRRRTRPRLIPARAGKTFASCSSGAPTAAHPRACGENMRMGALDDTIAGSSPRVRGKPAGSRPTPR